MEFNDELVQKVYKKLHLKLLNYTCPDYLFSHSCIKILNFFDKLKRISENAKTGI
jgi:hypothetical protein